MNTWNHEFCRLYIQDFERLKAKEQLALIARLNADFPINIYELHKTLRQRALNNERGGRKLLDEARQFFPALIFPEQTGSSALARCAIVLTAGGEGERLRLSLEARGFPQPAPDDFTKATFPLPDFYQNFGSLQINLALIHHLSQQYNLDIPVIVTTGPSGSNTERVIRSIINNHENFGLKRLMIVSQEARLHLTQDDRIAWYMSGDEPIPVTHPDETGGPVMCLKKKHPELDITPLNWLAELGADRILLLQATALYHPNFMVALNSASPHYDCVGAGILRDSFTEQDPYGTYVEIEQNGQRSVIIVEQNIRNEQTRLIKNDDGKYFLPYNTGFYLFDRELLAHRDLPDFATPPKEILPHLKRAPKVGYAATDLITLAQRPAVMAVPPSWYAAIKKADDLEQLSNLGQSYGLVQICRALYE